MRTTEPLATAAKQKWLVDASAAARKALIQAITLKEYGELEIHLDIKNTSNLHPEERDSLAREFASWAGRGTHSNKLEYRSLRETTTCTRTRSAPSGTLTRQSMKLP